MSEKGVRAGFWKKTEIGHFYLNLANNMASLFLSIQGFLLEFQLVFRGIHVKNIDTRHFPDETTTGYKRGTSLCVWLQTIFPNRFCNSFIEMVHVVIRALCLDKEFQ